MTVRRTIPHALALLLGIGAALLAACGQGTSGGIPAADAAELKARIGEVEQAVAEGRCSGVPRKLRQVDTGIDALPPSTDEQLRRALREGADRLLSVAVEECNANRAEARTTEDPEATETTDTTTTPPTTTEPTDTTTTPTTTTQPTDTTTTPTPTTPAPTTTTAPPPPPPVPAPPPPPTGTPGGGTTPEIP